MEVRGKKAGKAAKGAQKPKKAPKAKKPRQARLPGTEDNKIQEIESAALDYVEQRDERMELTKKEKAAKDALLAVMHANNKKTYVCGDLDISIRPEGEKLTVRVRKNSGEESEDIEDLADAED
jgi:hypothetical protein